MQVSDGQNPAPKPQDLRQRLVSNTVFNLLGQGYVVLLGVAVVPYVVHRLGAGLYGLVALVGVLGGFAGLFNLGIGISLAKHVSELYWKGQFDRIHALFRTAFTFSLLAGGAGCVLVLIFRAPLAVSLVHGDPSAGAYVEFAMVVTALGILTALPLEPLSALPVALQRFDISNRMVVLLSTIRNAGAAVVLALGFFFRGVLIVYLFASIVGIFGYAHYGRKLLPGLSLRPGLDAREARCLIGFSAPVFIAGLGGLVVHKVDRLLVAHFLPIAALAFYVIPYALAEKTGIGVSNITSVIFPAASELASMRARGSVRELYIRATKMVLLAAIPITIVLLAIPFQILRYWVGPEYAARGALTLQFLAGGFFFNILAHVPYVTAQGIGRPWIPAKYSMLNGGVNLVLFLLLIPRYGIAGAGAAFFISEILVSSVFIREMNRAMEVSLKELALEAYLRPLGCGLGVWILLRALAQANDSFSRLVLFVVLGLGTYAILALTAAIERNERAAMYSQLLRTLGLKGSLA
jgi:O-antigen/teichoic acid export membrane protein